MGPEEDLINMRQNAGRRTCWAGGLAQLLQCQHRQRLQADTLQSGPRLADCRAEAAVGLVKGLINMGQDTGCQMYWAGGGGQLLLCKQQGQRLQADALQSGLWLGSFRA